MFKTKEEMYQYIEENVGEIFNNPQKYLELAGNDTKINPLDYAIGFIHGVVNSSGFDLVEIEEDWDRLHRYNLELELINWELPNDN